MAVIFNPRSPTRRLPNRNSGDSAFIDRFTSKDSQAVQAATGNNPALMKAGDSFIGGTFLNYDPTQGIRVRFENGKEITIPSSTNPRIYQHFNPDGTIDVAAAIASGATNWDDYRRLGVSGSDFQKATEEAKLIQKGKAERLSPFVKDGSLDIIGAVGAGLIKVSDFDGWNVSEKDISDAQKVAEGRNTFEKYRNDNGNYDIVQAIKDGVDHAKIIDTFGLTENDIARYELVAKYSDSKGGIDIEKLLKDVNAGNKTENDKLAKEINEALGLDLKNEGYGYGYSAPQREYKPKPEKRDLPEGITKDDYKALEAQRDEIGKELMARGGVNTEEDKILNDQWHKLNNLVHYLDVYTNDYEDVDFGDNILTKSDIDNALVATAPGTLEIMTQYAVPIKGQSIPGFDVTQAVKDGVSDEFIRGLGYSQAGLDGIKLTIQYETADGGFDVSKAIRDGVSDDSMFVLGYTQTDMDNLRLLVKYETDIPDSEEKGFDISKAINDGVTDEQFIKLGYNQDNLSQLRLDLANIDSLEKRGIYNRDDGTLDWVKIYNVLDSQSEDPTTVAQKLTVNDGLKALGITDEQMEQGKDIAEWLGEVKTTAPDLYKEYEKLGLSKEFYAKVDEYSVKQKAEYDAYMKEFEDYISTDEAITKIYKEQGFDEAYKATQKRDAERTEQRAITNEWLESIKAIDDNGNINMGRVANELELLNTNLRPNSGLDAFKGVTRDAYEKLKDDLALYSGLARKEFDYLWGMQSQQSMYKDISPELKRETEGKIIDVIKTLELPPEIQKIAIDNVKDGNMQTVDIAADMRRAGINDDDRKKYINEITGGMTDAEYKELDRASDYAVRGFWDQMGLAFSEDPRGFMWEMALNSVPIYSTIRNWEHDSRQMRALSIGLDVLSVVPFLGAMAGAAKTASGGTLRTMAAVARAGTVSLVKQMAPIDLILHPKSTLRAIYTPIETILSNKSLPLHSIWGGAYSKMSIPKVPAGMTDAEAMATLRAMGDLTTQKTAGVKNIKVPIGGKGEFGTLEIRNLPLNEVFKGYTGTSTPFGPEFRKGMTVAEGGLFTAPEMMNDLVHQSAIGKSPLYVFKSGSETPLGMIDATGKLLDKNGFALGRIAPSSKIMGTDGKLLGYVVDTKKPMKLPVDNKGAMKEVINIDPTLADNIIVNKYGKPIAFIEDGMIYSSDPETIGRIYKGQPFYEDGVIKGIFQSDGTIIHSNTGSELVIPKEGSIVDANRKLVTPKKELKLVVGYIPDGTNVVSLVDGKTIIGKARATPSFNMIYVDDITELPKAVESAKSTKEMERMAIAQFKKGEGGAAAYEGFKQYKQWIEEENLIPSGSNLIPIIGDDGKRVTYFVRDMSGRKIEVNMLKVVKDNWFEEASKITKELNTVANDIKPQSISELYTRVFGNKKVANEVMEWMKKEKATLIGSGIDELYLNKNAKSSIRANDIDLAVKNPKTSGQSLFEILQNNAKDKEKIRMKQVNENIIIEELRGGVWEKIVDVDPVEWLIAKNANPNGLKYFDTAIVDGVSVMTPESQLNNLLDRMVNKFGDKGYDRWGRFVGAMGVDPASIGIKAPIPNAAAIKSMQVGEPVIMLRDIFSRNLVKHSSPAVKKANEALKKSDGLVATAVKAKEEAAVATKIAKSTNTASDIQTAEKAVSKATKAEETARTAIKEAEELTKAIDGAKTVTRNNESLLKQLNGIDPKLADDVRMHIELENNLRVARMNRINASGSGVLVLPRTVKAFLSEIERRQKELIRAEERYIESYEDISLRIDRLEPTDRVERLIEPERLELARIDYTDRPPELARIDRVDRVDRVDRPPQIPRVPEVPRLPESDDRRDIGVDKKGSVSWRQGAFWLTKIYEQGKWKTYYSPYAPSDAQVLDGTPQETFYARGKPPARMKHQMGVVDVDIVPQRGEPLHFFSNPKIKVTSQGVYKTNTKMPKRVKRAISAR